MCSRVLFDVHYTIEFLEPLFKELTFELDEIFHPNILIYEVMYTGALVCTYKTRVT